MNGRMMMSDEKKIRLNFILIFAMLIGMLAFGSVSVYAESPDGDITMTVSSSCYIYSKTTATSAYRADYVTFGEEIYVQSVSGDWATITYNGNTRYMLVKNLSYLKEVVIKNRVMVSPGAYACSTSSTLGYVFYGTEVSVLGSSTSKSGTTYVHCVIDNTYDADGEKVLGSQIEGYINAEYLKESSTPKIVNGGTSLYASAYGSGSDASLKVAVGYITTGEEVEMLMSNSTWSKIRYQGEEYYISTDKLDSKKLQILVGRAAQTVDAKPGSGWQHYSYWQANITVLNTYESENYGTYYYCKLNGDYGFIREYSSSGQQYIGYSEKKTISGSTSMYSIANSSSTKLMTLAAGTEVTVQYSSGNWARVEYNGTVGYVSVEKLVYPQYIANGKYYTSGYDIYRGSSYAAGKLTNEKVSLISTYSGRKYAYVQTADGTRYWMKLSSVTPVSSETTVYVSVPSATLHTEPNSSSSSVSVPYMSELTLCETYDNTENGAWSRVTYNDATYYLWQDTGESLITDTKSDFTYTGNTTYQQEAIDLALTYLNLNTGYGHGDSSGAPASDGKYIFDCSGFVSYVMNKIMKQYVCTYNISANLEQLYSTTGIYNEGYTGSFSAADVIAAGGKLDESLLEPGDVLFFNLSSEADAQTTGTGYNHCGIYLGNGEFIHCTHTWDCVCVMPLKGIYEEGFVAARRYLPTTVTAANATMYTTSQLTYVYSTNDSSTAPVKTMGAEEAVTLLYTDNGNWAYVEYESGQYGYILIKYLASTVEEASLTMYTALPNQKLYTTYSTSGSYITVQPGTKLTYMGRYSNSSYYKVKYDETLYYIYAPEGIDGIILEKEDFEALLNGGTEYILTANTYLRSSPDSSDSSNQIGLYKSGVSIYIISQANTVSNGKAWCYVKTADGIYGFMYLSVG